MGFLDGKVAAIFGVANKRSIAWGITQAMAREGATIALSYQNERMKDGVEKLASDLGDNVYVAPCDVMDEPQIDGFFDGLVQQHQRVDTVVHSIATAKRDELGGRFSETSWEGFALSQQVSAYSLIPLARAAAKHMEGGEGSILCLTYYGAEKVVQNYNVMGVAKASLEATTRYLADDLGAQGIRVNAISAGAIKTVSAMGVSGFGDMLDETAKRAPLRRNVSQEDVGNVAAFLASDLARGVTGQTIYVDAGMSILGM